MSKLRVHVVGHPKGIRHDTVVAITPSKDKTIVQLGLTGYFDMLNADSECIGFLWYLSYQMCAKLIDEDYHISTGLKGDVEGLPTAQAMETLAVQAIHALTARLGLVVDWQSVLSAESGGTATWLVVCVGAIVFLATTACVLAYAWVW